MVDIELDPEDYDYCIEVSIDRYRQRSDNSMEESFLFIDLQPDVATYTLPDEVQEVRECYRRVNGNSGGSTIDPFSLAMTQNIYMIQNPGGLGGGGAGQLATYDFAMQYQELVGRMFGRDVTFTWNTTTKKITFHRKFGSYGEQVGLHVYNQRPTEELLKDTYSKVWIRSAAIANAKIVIGQGRGKYPAGFAGPQGGVSLNGAEMKSEGLQELKDLDQEIKEYIEQHAGYGFTIG
jgi:hypothetical protein